MDKQIAEAAIKSLLAEIHNKLKGAEQIAKAARACADAGSTSEAVRVSMDLDQSIYDVGRLQDALTLLGRLAKD